MSRDPYDLEIIIGDETILDFVNVLEPEEVASFVAHKNRTPRWTFTIENNEDESLLDFLRALAEWFDTGDHDVKWYIHHGTDFCLAIPLNIWAMEVRIHLILLAGTFVQNTSQCLELRRFTLQKVKELLRQGLSDDSFKYGTWKFLMDGFAENEDNSSVQDLIDELVKIGLENLHALPLDTCCELSPISKAIFVERSTERMMKLNDARDNGLSHCELSWNERKVVV
ncbi:hypothetical protein KEM56_002873 [Ascosphaera pollenicola]|nr:hypothetical protein KEM56_002873 [Ascosphaera pollenicola]